MRMKNEEKIDEKAECTREYMSILRRFFHSVSPQIGFQEVPLMNTVRKKNIVITGSNRGLGLALATCFADCHWNVLCCTRDKNNRNSQSLKKFYRNIKLDVNSDEDIDHLKSFVLDTPIDVLINNAGIYTNEAFGHCSRKAMLNMYSVNAIAPLLISQCLYENLLLGENKLIVNVTGRMGTFKSYTGPGSYGYRMSKAAANMLTKIMAEELQSQNIKVISVHPGDRKSTRLNSSH